MDNSIREFSSQIIKSKYGNIFALTIIGQIEGHMILPPQNKTTKYEHILPLLVGIEEQEDIKGLLVLLNTMGGDVEAGLAISEMISGMKKPTVSLVLGGGHSIGVPLSVSTKYSYIANSATMTIHPIRITGQVIALPQTFEYFSKMQDRVVNFITANSRIDAATLTKLMLNATQLAGDSGTVLSSSETVSLGLIDSVGTISDAIAKLGELINTQFG